MKKTWVFILLTIFLSYASNVGADKTILAGGWCPFGKRAWKIAQAEVSSVISH